MEGISAALGCQATQDPFLSERLHAIFGAEITPSHLKVGHAALFVWVCLPAQCAATAVCVRK